MCDTFSHYTGHTKWLHLLLIALSLPLSWYHLIVTCIVPGVPLAARARSFSPRGLVALRFKVLHITSLSRAGKQM